MPVSSSQVRDLLEKARGRTVLTEPEGLALLEAMGIPGPRWRLLPLDEAVTADTLSAFPGERVVVKVVSPDILHKSDVGGVAILPRDPAALNARRAEWRGKFGTTLTGFLLQEFIGYRRELGHEFLLGLRWTDEFGPVVTLGPGGLYAEFMAGQFRQPGAMAILSPGFDAAPTPGELKERVRITRITGGGLRGQAAAADLGELSRLVGSFLRVAGEFGGRPLREFEINPLAVHDGRFVALDVLIKLDWTAPAEPPKRPVDKMERLFRPRSVAVLGVSEKLNPGHIIVNNLLREGFPRERIAIIKPGAGAIEGCRCWPDVASLPAPVDLCILSISAAQVPGALAELIQHRKAESLIVIPGGLEEKEGTAELVGQARSALAEARAGDWRGPVICGPNSLGIRSLPGHYDTMFIPEEKLPLSGPMAPIAVISNSGAFAVAKAGKLAGLNPRYLISAGNQMDLTIGDYLEHLAGDSDVRVFAVYVEGFRALDGQKFLRTARRLSAEGRVVILYRAGRTVAGAKATASHTAAVAGDYAVTAALAARAGVLVAGDLEEFEDLVRLFARLGDREVGGWRLGAMSNAGFECVAIADNLGRFELARFGPTTIEMLGRIFDSVRIGAVVDVHNPLDLTPMTPDAPFAEAARALLEDPGVDAALIGCVPLTAALRTVPGDPADPSDLLESDALAARLLRVFQESRKPVVAVIDGGEVFDPLVRLLERGGLPTFRSADRALAALGRFCEARIASRQT